MTIKETLKKDISRNINGVVKAENNKEETVINELEEYVITDEIRKHMNTLFERYSNSINNKTEDMGIWISGFFGSGKSHLLKMLGYIVENKEYNGKKTVEYFEEKVQDPILYGNIIKSSEKETDVIMFNIDNVSDQDTNQNKDSIVLAFQKKFNEHLGFSRDDIKVASLERRFWELGIFDKFKELFEEISGDTWEDSRRNMHFISDDFLETIEELEVKGFSVEAAERWLEDDTTEAVSSDSFCDYLNSYLKLKGKDHRILFLVDEIGQYIGDNLNLMLNLQTIVENLGVKFNGRVWVGVTSQQNIDELLKESNTKRVDFAKIQGRFKTMLSLSSSNIDEVIKKRLLEKKEIEKEDLERLYENKRIDINNLITFSKEGVTQKTYDDKVDFAEAYPFVGYQFNLLQKVLDKVRNMGHSGKHMSRGERSLLGSFQEAGIKMADKEVGSIVPFHYFYDSIDQFLEDDVRRPFIQAKSEKKCSDFEVDVLKLLFLLKGIDDVVAPTIENLTCFMVDSIDCNKIELEEKIKKALKKLEREVLIQKDAGRYYFLTNEEQDINREIDQETVEVKDKYKILDENIFEDIFDEKSIIVEETGNKYQFNRMIDEYRFGRPVGQLDLVILTPRAEEYDKVAMIGARDEYDLIIKFPEDSDFFNELFNGIEDTLKVESYLKKNRSTQRENIQRIIESKQKENRRRKKRITHLLEETIKNSTVYIGGHKKDIKARDPKKIIEEALKAVANHRFKKATLVKKKYDEKKIKDVLLTSFDANNQLMNINKDLNSNPNREAILELFSRINLQKSRGNRITVKDLVDYYTVKPYGWDTLTINGLVAELWVYKLINIEESGVRITNSSEAIKYLTKVQSKNLEKLLIQPKEEIDTELIKKVNNIIRKVLRSSLEVTTENPKDELMNVIRSKYAEVDNYIKECQRENLPGKNALTEWKDILEEILDIKGNSEKVLKEFLKLADDLEDEFEKYDSVKDFLTSQKKVKFIKGQEKIKEIESYQDYIGAIKENEAYKKLYIILEDNSPFNQIRLIDDLVTDIDTQQLEIITKEVDELKNKADEKTNKFEEILKNRIHLLDVATKKIQSFKDEISREMNIQTLTKGKKLENIVNDIEFSYRKEIEKEILTLKNETLNALNDKEETDSLRERIEKRFRELITELHKTSIKDIENSLDVALKDKEEFIKEAEGKAKKKERILLHKLKVDSKYNLETKDGINEYFENLEKEINQLKEKALKAIEDKKIVDIK